MPLNPHNPQNWNWFDFLLLAMALGGVLARMAIRSPVTEKKGNPANMKLKEVFVLFVWFS